MTARPTVRITFLAALAGAALALWAAQAGAQARCPATFAPALEGLVAPPGAEAALAELRRTDMAAVVRRHGGVEAARAALMRRAAALRAEAAGADETAEILAVAHERMTAALDCRP
jgi:hypothetical protein